MLELIAGIVFGFLVGFLYLYKVATSEDYEKLKEINEEELQKIMEEFISQVHMERDDDKKFENLKADCVAHYNIVKAFMKRDFNKEIDDKFHLNLKSIFERKNK